MKLVTSSQMRQIDKDTVVLHRISSEQLMERAGAGVADRVESLIRVSGGSCKCPILLFAGRGNNGGDAFAAARHLKERGYDPEVWLTMETKDISGDSMKHFGRMMATKLRVRDLPTERDWADSKLPAGITDGILVDGLLGTGISGAPRGPVACAIQYINRLASRNLVVAIDVPSGLDSDRGTVEGDAVRADITVTLGMPKAGMIEPAAVEYVGNIEVVDIGIPRQLTDPVMSDREFITAGDIRALFPRRLRASNKGDYGRVLIVAGAAGFAGAASLAARGALRSGTGLVTVLTPRSVAPVVAGSVPEAMVHSATEVITGSLTFDCLEKWGRDINEFDAILVGPGLTTHDQVKMLISRLLAACRKPVVLDADALNICAGNPGMLAALECPKVITPHPGEMARLMNVTAGQVQGDRFGFAARACEMTGAVVVLKGAGTVVAAKDRPMSVAAVGNPGMAKGGMGDVLGGLIAGLIAQGLSPFDAARAGVYLHGKAGDDVAFRLSQAGMKAGDLVDGLAAAFRSVMAR